ncbi:MAG: FAD-dependent monooxygenase, partial [Winogradskyella sp.]|nr:FAD-dependent monooxygenase [Winogradskyella sp.]
TDFKQTEEGWIVQIKHETKGEVTIHTKYLVDASGRQSHVCRKLGVSCNKKDALVGIGSFLNFDKNTAIKQEIILESAEVGWWYAATLPDQQVVLTLFTDASTAKDMKLQKPENWFALISKTKHIIKKINKASSHESIWTRNAFSHVSDAANRHNFLAVGDAACSFDPIASMGIGFAISSACHAAKAIIENDSTNQALASYNENIKSIFKNYLETKPLFYQ